MPCKLAILGHNIKFMFQGLSDANKEEVAQPDCILGLLELQAFIRMCTREDMEVKYLIPMSI